MRILVIGSGGREHALVWKLAQSPSATQLWCAPGNAGISRERLAANDSLCESVPIGAEDMPNLLSFAHDKKPDLIVVGPDNPLALGIVDLFEKESFAIWGPNQRAAQFEASKAFAQEFMNKYGIPTAQAATFANAGPAEEFVRNLGGCCVVKADGLALGKGVLMCRNLEESRQAIRQILVDKTFGSAGARIVIQEMLEGTEVSLHALCDGKTAILFPSSQDHKRALDGDEGLNTGGMGAYSPTPFLTEQAMAEADAKIIQPWLRGCQSEGIQYRGILYPGIMLTASGPRVLEFNARFGDPETQVYLTRLENDLVEVLQACLSGNLRDIQLGWRRGASVCVVMASAGYPGPYQKGKIIRGLEAAGQLPNTKVFHAGTAFLGEEVITSGGRVLGVTAWADDLKQAQTAAYRAVDCIRFDGAHFRRDIAAKGLLRK